MASDTVAFKAIIEDATARLVGSATDITISHADHCFFIHSINACSYLYRTNEIETHTYGVSIPDKLRVAALSITPKTDVTHKDSFFWEDAAGKIVPGEFRIAKYRETFLAVVREILGAEPHVICFPELAYPPISAALTDKFLMSLRTTIEKYARQSVVLVAGSHLRDTGSVANPFNVSFVITGELNRGRVKTRIHEVFKRRAAAMIGEKISTPPDIEVPVFITPFGRIAVLICIEALDPAIIWSLIRFNAAAQESEKIRLIVVPAFSRSREIESACKRLSYAANTAVCYVNYYDLHDEPVAIFISGKSSHELNIPWSPTCFSCNKKRPPFTSTSPGNETVVGRLFTIEKHMMSNIHSSTRNEYSSTFRELLKLGSRMKR